MEQSCENIFDDAKVESGKFDFVDILPYGSNYFTCGYTPLRVANGCYYNHSIAVAFSLIGKYIILKIMVQAIIIKVLHILHKGLE